MNPLTVKTLRTLRYFHKAMWKKNDAFGFSSRNVTCKGQAASDLIKQKLLSGKPTMIARFGSAELRAALVYHFAQLHEPAAQKVWRYICRDYPEYWWDPRVVRGLTCNAGFFPATNEALFDRFATLFIDDMRYVDVLGSWITAERFFNEQLFSSTMVSLNDLPPYNHPNPWSEALAGKTVLVIHPFTKSIHAQYRKRGLLFDDPRVLPEFELKTITSVQSMAYNDTGYATWFDALSHMCDQMMKIEFDIAIVGCGAYGFALSAFAKRIGKQAVHLGGATQLLFGIKGKRWGEMGNEHWMRPLPEEHPQGFEKIEGGCYW